MANQTQVIQKDVTIIGDLQVTGNLQGATTTKLVTRSEESRVVGEAVTRTVDQLISDMASDGKLVPVEKQELNRRWNDIATEEPRLLILADAQGFAAGNAYVDALTTAYAALYAYLYTSPGVIADLTTTTSITSATLIANWNAYQLAKTNLVSFLGTQTPATVTFTIYASGKNVYFHITKQLTLTNWDHYEVTVSLDNTTNWYSLKFDGTAVTTGTLGGDTDIYGEDFVHTNIPYGGTPDTPAGVLVYYKVRQVTRATTPVVGSWSASQSVTTGTIVTGDLTAALVNAAKIGALAVTTDKLDALAVTAAKIAANTITAAEIAADAITTSELAANAVEAENIKANAVTTDKLDALAVTAAKIAANTITAAEIAADAITTSELAANAVEAENIKAGVITADKITAKEITAREMKFSDDTFLNDAAIDEATQELFDFQEAGLFSSGGRSPYGTPVAVFEPDKIGATANPRVKFAGKGCVGVWSAATNKIDHGDCTDVANAPHVTGITPEALVNATFALSMERLALDGFGHYKMTKTAAAGGGWAVAHLGEFGIASMSGFSPSDILNHSFDIFVPTSGGPTNSWEIQIAIADCHGGSWFYSVSNPTVFGQWHRIDITRAIDAAATGVQVYIAIHDVSEAGEYVRVRNIQVEKSAFATPFTPTSRAEGVLKYAYPWSSVGAIEFWVRPYFNYDTALNQMIIDTNTSAFGLSYAPADDKITFYMTGATTSFNIKSPAFDAAKLGQWIYVKAYWDEPNDSYGLIVKNAAGTVDATVTSTTNIGAVTFPPYLCIGYTTDLGVFPGDFLISDLCFWSTKDTSYAHYTANKAWYSPSEVTNKLRNVRIGLNGIRLHNAPLILTDYLQRQIRISNADGLLALDAAGKVIHDIQNAPIISNQKFLGHLSWLDDNAYIASYNQSTATGIKNISLAGKIGASTNIKGALVHITSYQSLDTSEGLSFTLQVCSVYNDSTLTSQVYKNTLSIDASVTLISHTSDGVAMMPVFWVSGVPYISIYLTVSATGVSTGTCILYLIGVSA